MESRDQFHILFCYVELILFNMNPLRFVSLLSHKMLSVYLHLSTWINVVQAQFFEFWVFSQSLLFYIIQSHTSPDYWKNAILSLRAFLWYSMWWCLMQTINYVDLYVGLIWITRIKIHLNKTLIRKAHVD